MLSSYRRIFAAPGSLGFSAAGFVSRLPLSMTGIGVVTMLSQLRGEYGIAGAVSAALALSAAAFGPQIARLVDRYGQRRVARPAAAISVASVLALLACAGWGAPAWTYFVLAVGAGCMPNMGALVRARWAGLYRGSDELLHIAYSLESVVDELCFITGPILSVGLCTAVFPEAGPLLSAAFLAVGVALFTAQRRTEPAVEAHPAGGAGGPLGGALRSPGLLVLASTFVAVGAVFGSVDVVTVAFSDAHRHKGLSSLLLALYAAGSGLSGIVYGSLRIRGPLPRRFLTGTAVLAVSMLPLLVVKNLVALAAALFVAGLTVSPLMVTAMGLVERIVPARQLTEGMTWTSTGLEVGVALGSSAGGWVVDGAGAGHGYLVTVSAGLLAAATAFLGSRRLRSAPKREGTVTADARDTAHGGDFDHDGGRGPGTGAGARERELR
ncbi:MFS transporter [Phaeacidiphilus oryzae]|uniref:MFS transporter n=1 Tax=Phaeacidiphilus oryzae TaxID=348818 RepID=UPI0007C68991|nr:MFS transporter [Phaeacidiphilus oryzae]